MDDSDIKFITQQLSQREGFSVKGKDVCLDNNKFGIEDFPEEKEDVPYHLALALEDEENLAWYSKLVRERRVDFLKNCLNKTLDASAKGIIRKTKGAYFAGVIKLQTSSQERIRKYKEKHYKHTSLYDYGKIKK